MSVVASPCYETLKLKNQNFSLLTAQLTSADVGVFMHQLADKLKHAPLFFEQIALVLCLQKIKYLSGIPNYSLLRELLQEKSIYLAGVINGNTSQEQAAQKAGLPVLKGHQPALEKKAYDTTVVVGNVGPREQQVADKGDLIVIGTVHPQAEVLAKDNIHIYGALYGKALAGISGNTRAKIFCNSLFAEFVAINGCFRTHEELPDMAISKPVSIALMNDTLEIKQVFPT